MLDSNGFALGLIAVLFKRPIEHSEIAVQLIRIFATRAAVELERRDQLAQLEYRASFDLLTGLPNRSRLEAIMDAFINSRQPEVVETAQTAPSFSALLLVDLDRFKEINVTLGHAVGDKVLAQIAARLNSGIADSVIARIGGDEFAVWITNMQDLEHILLSIAAVKQATTAPLDVEGYPLELSASIAVSIHPVNANSASTLLRAADIAMYEAKSVVAARCFMTAPLILFRLNASRS
ncbi:MAG: GGDEF domain-containing protein [Gammaproteobacteria bacterium]|nr:GGDEF domain-containing protein [Gammaproteobacteria bacterium]